MSRGEGGREIRREGVTCRLEKGRNVLRGRGKGR